MEGFLDTATQLCIDWGYWGLFLSAFVAGSIVPFSSEAVMVVLVRLGLDPHSACWQPPRATPQAA